MGESEPVRAPVHSLRKFAQDPRKGPGAERSCQLFQDPLRSIISPPLLRFASVDDMRAGSTSCWLAECRMKRALGVAGSAHGRSRAPILGHGSNCALILRHVKKWAPRRMIACTDLQLRVLACTDPGLRVLARTDPASWATGCGLGISLLAHGAIGLGLRGGRCYNRKRHHRRPPVHEEAVHGLLLLVRGFALGSEMGDSRSLPPDLRYALRYVTLRVTFADGRLITFGRARTKLRRPDWPPVPAEPGTDGR